MDPLTALVATIGLLAVYRQERAKGGAATNQSFHEWLGGHGHEELSALVGGNSQLTQQIERVVQGNDAKAQRKLDAIGAAMASMATRIDVLTPLAESAAEIILSDQAVSIMETFADSSADWFVHTPWDSRSVLFVSVDKSKAFERKIAEPTYLKDDLETLELLGFVTTEEEEDGRENYRFTRSGEAFIRAVRALAPGKDGVTG